MLRKLNGTPMPIKVRYMIAYNKDDYDAVYKFLKGTEFDGVTVTFPTILAYVNDKVEGVLCTYPSKEAIIAGPLYIKDKSIRRATLQMKLVDAYESLLINLGIKAYLFAVKMSDKARIAMLREIGLKPYNKDESAYWYIRRF